MSLSPSRRRKGSDNGHTVSQKHTTGHAEVKNAAHGQTGTQGKKKAISRSVSTEQSTVHSRSSSKKPTKATRKDDAHGPTTTKPQGVTSTHDKQSHTKAQSHVDGKLPKNDRSESHGKSNNHGTKKKQDGQKPQKNKHKTKQKSKHADEDSDSGLEEAATTEV